MIAQHASRIFLDTNVLLYALDEGKQSTEAREAIRRGHAISVQVLNEFASVVQRKRLLDADLLLTTEAKFREMFQVIPLTLDTHDAALRLSTRYRFAFYDALIIAAALEAGCDELYSEDMQHGQRIEGSLRIINPFR